MLVSNKSIFVSDIIGVVKSAQDVVQITTRSGKQVKTTYFIVKAPQDKQSAKNPFFVSIDFNIS